MTARAPVLCPTKIGRKIPWEVAKPHIIERLMARTEKRENGCWIWLGQKTRLGYGLIGVMGKVVSTHRLAYRVFKGDLPDDVDVCHSCDDRACLAPTHLWAGDHLQNMVDASKKGRLGNQKKTHCIRGHPLFGANLYVPPGTKLRACKECKRIRKANYRRRVKCRDHS